MKTLAWGILSLSFTGCVTIIRPPASPEDPVTVAVVDHGFHASLLLPSPDGGSVEFAFGEWDWFALNHDAWYNACPTLCCPNTGALGRRQHLRPPITLTRAGVIPCEELLVFEVSRSRALALQARLEKCFQDGIETRVYNPVLGLDLVKSDEDYCFFMNCNHKVGQWLRELGCDLVGTATISSFRLEGLKR